ncbi:MAG: TlpA disulfide reductase family protein [Anaerolineales bacterium]|jgi:cytochrome c biogenesis protein CcmG/thiol:disulfide interchange protein DsbE
MVEETAIEPTQAGESSSEEIQGGRRFTWGTGAIWLLLLAFLLLLFFGLRRTQQGPVQPGAPAPQFSLTTFDGQDLDTTHMRGQVILVNFWASWCVPCEQEAAELQQAYENYKDKGVVFIGVNYVDTEPEALDYMARFDITYPNGPDLGTRISQAYRIRGVPETYIMGANGNLVEAKIGPYASLAEIQASLDRALGSTTE